MVPTWTPTRFARNGDTHIGWAAIGDGPPDVVEVGISLSHLEIVRGSPQARRWSERLASFGRLVQYDRRGSGVSDRTVGPVPIEVEVADLLAVLDAADSPRPYLFGYGVGGSLALLFAAVHPDRCTAVIAYSTPARFVRSDDYPYGWDGRTLELFLSGLDDGVLVSPQTLSIMAPTMADDAEFAGEMERMLRAATTPGQARDAFATYAATDIRHILGSVGVPVLVLHRRDDRLFPLEQSRDLAARLPDATFVELPGSDWAPTVGDSDAVLDEIQAFVTGARPAERTDRQLATVLFTDVVRSTETVASIGDRRWRDVLDRHDEIVLREVERGGGRRIASTGDGVIAMFTGPAQAIRTALAVRDALSHIGVSVRAGLHTGEVEIRGGDVAGIAVHIGKRVTDHATGGEVLVSRTLPDLVAGSGLEFESRGEHELKGVPGRWQLFAVVG